LLSILADKNIYRLQKFLPDNFRLQTFDPEQGMPDLSGIDALLVRTVSKITPKTVRELPSTLKFIGTASTGTDHVDKRWLQEEGVAFASAGGCNARAVAEYVVTGLLEWSQIECEEITEQSVGIIGVGNVGQQVDQLLTRCNIQTVCYDPPRQARELGFTSSGLAEALDCDILTLHVPLNKEGKYATHHWLNEEKLKNHRFKLVINAARGGVADEKALLWAKTQKKITHLITDVWENEPCFSSKLMKKSLIATPHIAGYSKEAKTRATSMIVSKLCEYFEYSYTGIPEDNWVEQKQISSQDETRELSEIRSLLRKLHPLFTYHFALEKLKLLSPEEKARKFGALRTEMPYRNEFKHISLPENIFKKYDIWEKLGLRSYSKNGK